MTQAARQREVREIGDSIVVDGVYVWESPVAPPEPEPRWAANSQGNWFSVLDERPPESIEYAEQLRPRILAMLGLLFNELAKVHESRRAERGDFGLLNFPRTIDEKERAKFPRENLKWDDISTLDAGEDIAHALGFTLEVDLDEALAVFDSRYQGGVEHLEWLIVEMGKHSVIRNYELAYLKKQNEPNAASKIAREVIINGTGSFITFLGCGLRDLPNVLRRQSEMPLSKQEVGDALKRSAGWILAPALVGDQTQLAIGERIDDRTTLTEDRGTPIRRYVGHDSAVMTDKRGYQRVIWTPNDAGEFILAAVPEIHGAVACPTALAFDGLGPSLVKFWDEGIDVAYQRDALLEVTARQASSNLKRRVTEMLGTTPLPFD